MVDDDAESSVRTVLRQEAYPWYDSQTDQVSAAWSPSNRHGLRGWETG